MIEVIDLRTVPKVQWVEWAFNLAIYLRASDIAEIEANHRVDHASVVLSSVCNSDRGWCVLKDGQPVVLCGRAPVGKAEAQAWFLATDELYDPAVQRFVSRRCHEFVDLMHEGYPKLWNYIDARNTKTLRWLEWLGFSVTEALPEWGNNGELFYIFEKVKPDV
jgi:hypothetical protein